MSNVPVAKADVIKLITPKVESLVDKIVGKINVKVDNFLEGSTVYVDVADLFKGQEDAVVAKAKAKVVEVYKAKGWNIHYDTGDYRDREDRFVLS